VSNKVLEKLFGFMPAEDQKNEGGSLLSFKLLNLAIVLSLASMLLNILSHRNLPFLLDEKEENAQRREREPLEQAEREETIAQQRAALLKRMEEWQVAWRWWHYSKVYVAFFIWFLLPITIILCTFYWYPLTTLSVPSVMMILSLLVLLAVNGPDCWRSAYKPIGTLLQVMMCVCYLLYFVLLDYMAAYDLNDAQDRQQYHNMKVLWGQYLSA